LRPVGGHLRDEVSKKGKEPGRKAIVEVRFGTVALKSPARPNSKGKSKPLTIDAVWVEEVRAPGKAEPLEWMLLTNVGVRSFEEAMERICWYRRRVDIEAYHQVLKWGCTVEDCGLGDKEAGLTVLWRGWQRLTDISATWRLLQEKHTRG
jgi:hypothetical protein